MKSFPAQLEISQIQEFLVSEVLAKYYSCGVVREQFGNPHYDGTLVSLSDGNTHTVTYEYKDERMCSRKTGNHFLEVFSRGKASGILITKADLWVVQPDEFNLFIMPTWTIRWGMVECKWKQVKGGDKGPDGKPTSTGLLVPLDWMEKHKETIIIDIMKVQNVTK